MAAPTALVVNRFSGVVHLSSCEFASGCIPWPESRNKRDRPCNRCRPDLGEGE